MNAVDFFLLPYAQPRCFGSSFLAESNFGDVANFCAQLLWPKWAPDGKPFIVTAIFSLN